MMFLHSHSAATTRQTRPSTTSSCLFQFILLLVSSLTNQNALLVAGFQPLHGRTMQTTNNRDRFQKLSLYASRHINHNDERQQEYPQTTLSRRSWFHTTITSAASILITSSSFQQQSATAAEQTPPPNELPLALRPFTKLAPLGPATTTSTSDTASSKAYNLPLDELSKRLTRDLTVGATGKGGYIVTGDLSPELFRDDCIFIDPTNSVNSLSQYRKALEILFDPETSTVELVEPLIVNTKDGTISGTYRSQGYLKLPWKPYVSPYDSKIVYTIDSETGLIAQQSQSWSKSASQALQETFTPSFLRRK